MNWKAFLVTLPINALMIYLIYLDIKEMVEEEIKIKKKLDNLKSDNIYLDLTDDELNMLSSLANLERCSEIQYLRSKIKSA